MVIYLSLAQNIVVTQIIVNYFGAATVLGFRFAPLVFPLISVHPCLGGATLLFIWSFTQNVWSLAIAVNYFW